jgi:hypothetical protein
MPGHSGPAMTLRRYAHVLEDMEDEGGRAMDELFKLTNLLDTGSRLSWGWFAVFFRDTEPRLEASCALEPTGGNATHLSSGLLHPSPYIFMRRHNM